MTKSEIALIKQQQSPSGLVVAACLIVLVWGARAGQDLIVPLLLAAMLAFMAAPLVRALRRLRAPNWMAVIVAALIIMVPLGFAVYGLGKQVQSFTTDYPKILAFIDDRLRALVTSEWAQRLGVHSTITLHDLTEKMSDKAGASLQFAMTALQTLLAATSEAVLVVLFALSMLASREHLYRCGKRILSRWEGIEAAKMLEATTSLVEKFLLTKMLVAGIVGVVSALAMWGLGIKYSYLLGMVVGILTLLPEVGFLISLAPVILVALATDSSLTTTGIGVALLLGIHLVEANLLTPRLVGRRINLNALATFFGLFAGGLLWGVWGMFLSVPILGVIRIVFSVSPNLAPWGDLLAERDDRELTSTLVRRRLQAWQSGKTPRTRPRTVVTAGNPATHQVPVAEKASDDRSAVPATPAAVTGADPVAAAPLVARSAAPTKPGVSGHSTSLN